VAHAVDLGDSDEFAVVAVRMLCVPNGEKATLYVCPERRGGLLYIDARCTDVQMVEADAASVESRLVAGEIACPGCGGSCGRGGTRAGGRCVTTASWSVCVLGGRAAGTAW
jgi:hypothetical protein